MIPTEALFEAHLTVVNLEQRAMHFDGELLVLEFAAPRNQKLEKH
jgi:hypothetical protein